MPDSTGDPFVFRSAETEDLEALLALETACFESPWARAAFAQELVLPHAEVWLAFESGVEGKGGASPAPVGYINFWIVAGEISLLNVAVHPRVRRRGLASLLLSLLEMRGRERQGEIVFLELRRSNESAFCLYRGAGYQQIGIRKGYYGDNREDAIVMSKLLDCDEPGE
ncbi:MAG: ribosomal protein S18-alanine N-acetyltransferase [Myxococcota bacterium]|nr:ribosomal protein S18-alanine N-acetyltransferase [Myxococcota bacterium]